LTRHIFTLIGFFLGLSSVFGQTLTYDVIRSDKSMGQTIVERHITGNEIAYSLNTKTAFRVIFLIEVEYDLQETFLGKWLQSGTSFNSLNGSIQKKTSISKRQKDYQLIIDGISTSIAKDTITESVSEIYFEEPFNGKEVFSAYFARYLNFEQIDDHKYSLTSPDGTNIYTYENGICTRVDISRDFATFSQVLLPELLANVRKGKIKGF
jgi:hypothetical protein